MKNTENRLKICIITLGCKINQYESIELAFRLRAAGHRVTETREPADLYIVNTCAVTQFAEKKSRYEIARITRTAPNAKIIVCGCASQFNAAQFTGENVVKTLGTDKTRIPEIIQTFQTPHLNGKTYSQTSDAQNRNSAYKNNRVFIKVQDGCNNFCSYCIVPHLRGRSRSRRISDITAEISAIPESVKEITLTGIDLSSYGLDINTTLADLCTAVNALNRPFRLSSFEVRAVTPEFLQTLKSCANFLPHFHLSLQSGSDEVLHVMNRKYTTAEYNEKVRMVRTCFSDAALTTDIIVGFPKETETNFEETLNFIKQIRFNSAHIFPYSCRTGTAAAALKPLRPAVVTARAQTLAAVQSQITADILKTYIGRTLRVLIESRKQGVSAIIHQATSKEYLSVRIHSQNPLPLDWCDVLITEAESAVLVSYL